MEEFENKITDAFNFNSNKRNKTEKSFSVEEFENKLMAFLIKTDQPFDLVENDYFCDLLEYLEPDLKMFSAGRLKRRIMN
jgi:hypothetical protein